MQIIGIDPGQKGGIASLAEGKAEAYLMPETVSQIVDMIRGMAQPGCTLAVERALLLAEYARRKIGGIQP